VFYETQGQPGLVSWLGELLTETYNETPTETLTLAQFETVYARALHVLPNNNILNIISKTRQEPYKSLVLELFRTDEKRLFRYDNPTLNFLYLNGVIDVEETSDRIYVKFPSPFVQKRLFNYFADELFGDLRYPYAAFDPLDDVIVEGDEGLGALNVGNLLRRYGDYVQANHEWLLKNAPRRADLRVHEAVYHFNLYMYLFKFLQHHGGRVWPEFPTGNGQADLIIHYADQVYGVEVKSFSTRYEYNRALGQAARYGRHLGLDEITLALFVEAVDDANRAKYEAVYEDAETGVTVKPVFVVTGAY
jgi:hypothetical protein